MAAADWIERHRVNNESLVIALERDLDRGEAETITIALELGADLALLDERVGRRAPLPGRLAPYRGVLPR